MSELYKERAYRLDKARSSRSRIGSRGHALQRRPRDYPYKGWSTISKKVLKRDGYACVSCGFQSGYERKAVMELCTLRHGHVEPDWRPPRSCSYGLTARIARCGVCKYYGPFEWSYIDASGLVVHHIDHDSRNNSLGNLVTLCDRCHNRKPFRGPRRSSTVKASRRA